MNILARELSEVKTLDVDLNDVLMDNMTAIIDLIYKLTGKILRPFHFSTWDSPLGDLIGIPNEDFLTLAYKTPSTQLAALPHYGAREFLNSFKARGGTVNIVTATCMTIDQIASWLEKFGILFDEIVITGIKMGKNPLFDDNPVTIAERVLAGLPTYKFVQPWNKDVYCPYQISTWQELYAIFQGQASYKNSF